MRRSETKNVDTAQALRASVSFPPDLYRSLEEIAKEKRGSIAWVVRDAAERYVADQWPLLERQRA